MAKLRLLGLAAGTGRVACVYLRDQEVRDWRMSSKAARSPELAAKQAAFWIEHLRPDVVVTERVLEASRKGARTKAIIEAMAAEARARDLLVVALPRQHEYADKYAEAEALAARYPALTAWLPPKRRFYDNEPRNTVLFEALSLADAVQREGPAGLARAMG